MLKDFVKAIKTLDSEKLALSIEQYYLDKNDYKGKKRYLEIMEDLFVRFRKDDDAPLSVRRTKFVTKDCLGEPATLHVFTGRKTKNYVPILIKDTDGVIEKMRECHCAYSSSKGERLISGVANVPSGLFWED